MDERAAGPRRRPLRLVAGGAILAAIGLLWPFADWNWWPVVIGLGVLVLLYLLRLNWLLLGWAPHLAGLVTVTLLLWRTGPWVWGFAAGLALLGYGLVRLPDWRLLAVGVSLTSVFGAAYGISQYRTDTQRATEHARADAEQAANVMATAAELVLPSLANSVAGRDARTACALLGPVAGGQFAAAHAAADCATAMTALAARVTDPRAYPSATLPPGSIVKRPDVATVDTCRARWAGSGTPPGPTLGRFELRRYQADRYLIVGYAPC
ncbi:MAG: hypothetical protein ACR2G2_17810 [Pseudonocardia sp.]